MRPDSHTQLPSNYCLSSFLFLILPFIYLDAKNQHAHFIPMVGVEKERRIYWYMVMQRQQPLLELPRGLWPCAGGLSAVNAVGSQLRDPINNVGLTPDGVWWFKKINGCRRRGNREESRE